jgi:iron complex outermembrane receptor protein
MSYPGTHHSLIFNAVLAASSLLVADIAIAQAQTLEEVVVTARKRSESLQNVPMAVSAFSTQQLQDAQIDDITDLQRMVPNVTINETSGLVAGAVQVFIRGIGNDPGFDQGVGIYVDDVYLNRTTGSLLEVYDVERIEVLKGPQGNLYGRNTIGGAIRYVSREPGDELEAGIELKTGTDKLFKVKGNVSGPIIDDTLYGGLGFAYQQRDGFQTNIYDDSEWADKDVMAMRGTLLWKATDNLKVKLVGDYSKDESKPGIPNRVAVNEEGINTIDGRIYGANEFYGEGTGIVSERADLSLPSNEDEVNTANLFPGFNVSEIETQSLAATITWDISDAWTLKSVSAYRSLENPRSFDFDGSDQIFINTSSFPESEDLSQELQLNYTSDTVKAVFGLYYLDAETQNSEPGVTDQSTRLRFFDESLKTTFEDNRELESTSVYANVDWDFAENWQLSLGGRYTEDKKSLETIAQVDAKFYAFALTSAPGGIDLYGIAPGQEAFVETQPGFLFWFPNGGAETLIARDVGETPMLDSATISRFTEVSYAENTANNDKWDEFSPSAKLSYSLGEDTLIYGGFSSGFKSGGFATDGSEATPYEPEIVESWSLGLKTTLLDGTLRINAEAFYNEYTDKQLTTIELTEANELTSTRANVGEVESSGFEAELTWLPGVDGLMVNLNVGYLDAEVTEYLEQQEDPDTGDVSIVDISDDRALGFQPEWTGMARVAYDFDIGSAGSMLIAGDIAYRDEMFTDSPIDTTSDFATQAVSGSLTTYNAVIAFTSSDQKWRVALEGKNLTDERELVNTFNVSNVTTGGYTRERTWAFSVGYTL